MRVFLLIALILFTTPALAVVITTPPPIVPANEIVRRQTIPAVRTTYYRKGDLTVVDKPAQTICYDKINRKVLCVDEAAAPKAPEIAPLTNQPVQAPAPIPVQVKKPDYRPVQNQYNMDNSPVRSQYEQ